MKKLVIVVLVVLTFVNVNGQEKKIEFTTINSSKIVTNIDSVFNFTPNSFISIADKKVTLSINMDFENTTESVNEKSPKVQLVGYYQIAEKLIFTRPEWNQTNVDAFGFKLFLCLK